MIRLRARARARAREREREREREERDREETWEGLMPTLSLVMMALLSAEILNCARRGRHEGIQEESRSASLAIASV